MHVLATAGHVDHGKSTLVRALTGMEPDRFAEERRRGMTIDLGYAWTTLAGGEQLAFVDVPGHRRFIGNMLAGLGPAPAVLFVVAADEGWSQQSSEHAAALSALRVQHAVLAITRSDLAAPGRTRIEALARLRLCGLDKVDAVPVSGTTGVGLGELEDALARLVARLPSPAHHGPVRLWIDRSFVMTGAGTVVTGTLTGGTVTQGDVLTLRDRTVTVRSIQALGARRDSVSAVARVALNLRGVAVDEVARGDVLLTRDSFATGAALDARLVPVVGRAFSDHPMSQPAAVSDRPGFFPGGPLPQGEFVLHVGTAAVPVRVRPLGGDIARLTLARTLPLRAGDRAVLRDPGRQVVAAGVLVLDADPPRLSRRGAGRARAVELAAATGRPEAAEEVRRRGAVLRSHLMRLGIDTTSLGDVRGWLIDPGTRREWERAVPRALEVWARDHPLDPEMPRAALGDALGVPEPIIDDLATSAGCVVRKGRVTSAAVTVVATLGHAEAGLATLLDRLAAQPFAAPDHDLLVELGLGPRELAVAVRSGRLLQLADGIVLAPGAPARAAAVLSALPQPFTLSAARQALSTTRRVAVPLLEHLDALFVTERINPTTRRVLSSNQLL